MTGREAWLHLLQEVLEKGREVSPRGKKTLEIPCSTVVIDMTRPVVNVRERKLGYRFMCAEAAWILSGDDRVETIRPYSPQIASFSDDGVKFFGAYGPKFREQLDYVVGTLVEDTNSRQAVFNIWRENPPRSKDTPCTLSCAFMIRGGKLETYVTMRSNDIWLGTVYDVFNASMWSAYVALSINAAYRKKGSNQSLELGDLYHTALSRHIYEENILAAEAILYHRKGGTVDFDYRPFCLNQFSSGDKLTGHLWNLARREALSHNWLYEMASR